MERWNNGMMDIPFMIDVAEGFIDYFVMIDVAEGFIDYFDISQMIKKPSIRPVSC